MIKKLYDSLDSTNIRAHELLKRNTLIPPFWVQAYNQYKGKGMGSNSWESEAGKSITASLVVAPGLEPSGQFGISIAVSLALCDLLNLFFEDVKIKWPNDILVNDRKIAGLLIEHAIIGDKIIHSIIGIGLNVNQEIFSPEIPNPVSFKMIYGKEFNLDELVELLLSFLLNRLETDNLRQIDTNRGLYLKKLFRYMVFTPFRSEGKWFNARIIGVDEFGRLMLEKENGAIRSFGFKEVEFID